MKIPIINIEFTNEVFKISGVSSTGYSVRPPQPTLSTGYSVQPPQPSPSTGDSVQLPQASPSTGDSAYATVHDNDEYSSVPGDDPASHDAVPGDDPASHDDMTTVLENQCGYHTDV